VVWINKIWVFFLIRLTLFLGSLLLLHLASLSAGELGFCGLAGTVSVEFFLLIVLVLVFVFIIVTALFFTGFIGIFKSTTTIPAIPSDMRTKSVDHELPFLVRRYRCAILIEDHVFAGPNCFDKQRYPEPTAYLKFLPPPRFVLNLAINRNQIRNPLSNRNTHLFLWP
jgi:hypothetical protein